MEDKRLKQFTFYDLYYEALKGLPDEAAGRMAKNICKFMFTMYYKFVAKVFEYQEHLWFYNN